MKFVARFDILKLAVGRHFLYIKGKLQPAYYIYTYIYIVKF